MANRVNNGAPVNGATVSSNCSGAAVGTKLTYTVPAGRQAKLSWAGVGNFAGGAPTVSVNYSNGVVFISMGSGTTPFSVTAPAMLNAGDQITVSVTALAAGSSFDAAITAEEYLAA